MPRDVRVSIARDGMSIATGFGVRRAPEGGGEEYGWLLVPPTCTGGLRSGDAALWLRSRERFMPEATARN